ncbi:MAG: UDP-N-acetylmuramoyl-tripeptide--D-alanyl-D-alanine ligase [bacterium]
MKRLVSRLILGLLARLACQVARRGRIKLVGITGSVGKTTAKEAIAQVLGGVFRVAKTPKNANTEWGVMAVVINPGFRPVFTADGRAKITFGMALGLIARGLWQLVCPHRREDVLVLELAADRPGDIKFFNQFLAYDVVAITNIGQVHLEFYDNWEQLRDEKLSLIDGVKSGGLVIVNQQLRQYVDTERLNYRLLRCQTFGQTDADMIGRDFELSEGTASYTIATPAGDIRIVAPHNRQMWLAAPIAALVGIEFGLHLDQITKRLTSWVVPEGRFAVQPLARGVVLINDAYNANPDSMRVALQGLQDIAAGRGRRVAILGGMRELGSAHEAAHLELGRSVPHLADVLIAVGQEGELISEGAKLAGMPSERIYEIGWPATATSVEAAARADDFYGLLQDNDTVLVKASNAIGLSGVAEALKQRLN